MDYIYIGIAFFFGLAAGLYFISQKALDENETRIKVEEVISRAHGEGKEIRNRAEKQVKERAERLEQEKKTFASQIENMEKMLEVKTASAAKREAKVSEIQKALSTEEAFIKECLSYNEKMNHEMLEKLCVRTGLTPEVVKEQAVLEYERAFKEDTELRIQRQFEWSTEAAVRMARNALSESMYRYGAPTSVEYARSDIKVQHDEVKGRIVGRGGRLIAFFEMLFGVDVIFNDEPNTIIVSCFNLVQQEIARTALERLMKEKNITEEAISRAKVFAEQEVDKLLKLEGERALKILGLANMPPDFAKLVGRLKFRTSYGQNIMSHCFEVGYFARLIAGEIGADTKIAFLGGFFHDIGKAIDQEVGGSHDVLSKEILEKYGFSWEITHAAWTHHNAIPQETVEARIVQAADAISAGRPGARAESVERYLAKIKDLQETALSFMGVKKAYAINAGREVRLIVEPDKVQDSEVVPLAQKVAAKVQEKGGYPGRIKVVTVRSTKATDYAR